MDTRESNGIAFLVSAGIMAEIVAKACSSPQTTELNADERAPTLMKWVNIGLLEGTGLVLVAAAIDRRHRAAILIGGLGEAAITLAQYRHARDAGLASDAPPTERHSSSTARPPRKSKAKINGAEVPEGGAMTQRLVFTGATDVDGPPTTGY